MRVFHGIGVSPGIAEGTAFLMEQGRIKVPKYWLHDREIIMELERYQKSLQLSKDQLEQLKPKLTGLPSNEHLHILEGHIAMLDDILLTKETADIIQNEKINAEWALTKTQRKIVESFSKIDEEYFRERQMDVVHVIERIQRNLLGRPDEALQKIEKPVIIVAHDLSPADLAHLPRNKIIGFVTDVGGRTSHTGIVAASMEIPAVLGTEMISQYVRTGDQLILDGLHGVAVLGPNEETLHEYQALKQDYLATEKNLQAELDLPSETTDHHQITLSANMELIEEIPFIQSHGANGIGLYRTEFLYLNSSELPSEEKQVDYYQNILKAFAPEPVTMRTYDLGGDKSHHPTDVSINEPNPALGLRAIRYCLQAPEVFQTQLRAMLRASPHGNLHIMFPLISGHYELLESRRLTREVMDQLRKEGHQVAENIPIGIMIETPAAVMIADLLADEVDFFCVGTNDLIQYTLAVDRINEHVAYLYNPMHPAILRMLKQVTQVGKQKNIPVHLCGEMASDPVYVPILVALGFDQLSMNAVVLPRVKHILRSLSVKDCMEILHMIEPCGTAAEAYRTLASEMHRRFPDYFEPYREPTRVGSLEES